jgi:hypothetical protein
MAKSGEAEVEVVDIALLLLLAGLVWLAIMQHRPGQAKTILTEPNDRGGNYASIVRHFA